MKDISQITACVIDNGKGIPIALRMAQKAKRVLYWSPYEKGSSTIQEACLGDGFPDIERTMDFWPIKNDIDLFIFPDIERSGLQLELESQGKAVWGSRKADALELNREKFLNVIERIGLRLPEYEIVAGLTKLRAYLEDKEDQYIKVSRWRGDFETYHWRNWQMDRLIFDLWGTRFGPLQDRIRFLVFPAIKTDLEIGADTYTVDGQWPDVMLNGLECKNKSYFGVVTPRTDMPDQVQDVLEAFGPVLGSCRARTQFSAEIRIKGDEAFFLDPTPRLGLPSTASQLLLWHNLPEIIWAGANGQLVQPEYDEEYSMEACLTVPRDHGLWSAIQIPKELVPHVQLANCCFVDGSFCFPPDPKDEEEVGWLVVTGQSPKATLDKLKQLREDLPDGIDADVETLAGIIAEVESARQQDIPVTDEPMPEPGEVIESHG